MALHTTTLGSDNLLSNTSTRSLAKLEVGCRCLPSERIRDWSELAFFYRTHHYIYLMLRLGGRFLDLRLLRVRDRRSHFSV